MLPSRDTSGPVRRSDRRAYCSSGVLIPPVSIPATASVHPESALLSSAETIPSVRGRRSLTSQHVAQRSEEHTSELQSRGHLVCRLLLEKKNKSPYIRTLATS